MLCVQGNGTILSVVCFVFSRKAECWLWCVFCSGEKREAAVTKVLTVVCFVFKRMSECQKQSALIIIIITFGA